LSGKDFQSDIFPSLQLNREKDTEEGGLTLTYAGSSYRPNICYNNMTVTMNLELFCKPNGDREIDKNDVSDLTYVGFNAD